MSLWQEKGLEQSNCLIQFFNTIGAQQNFNASNKCVNKYFTYINNSSWLLKYQKHRLQQ